MRKRWGLFRSHPKLRLLQFRPRKSFLSTLPSIFRVPHLGGMCTFKVCRSNQLFPICHGLRLICIAYLCRIGCDGSANDLGNVGLNMASSVFHSISLETGSFKKFSLPRVFSAPIKRERTDCRREGRSKHTFLQLGLVQCSVHAILLELEQIRNCAQDPSLFIRNASLSSRSLSASSDDIFIKFETDPNNEFEHPPLRYHELDHWRSGGNRGRNKFWQTSRQTCSKFCSVQRKCIIHCIRRSGWEILNTNRTFSGNSKNKPSHKVEHEHAYFRDEREAKWVTKWPLLSHLRTFAGHVFPIEAREEGNAGKKWTEPRIQLEPNIPSLCFVSRFYLGYWTHDPSNPSAWLVPNRRVRTMRKW